LTIASRTSLAALEERSRATCVVFTDHPLPTGVQPAAGDIGLESAETSTLLHVRRGFTYDGDDAEVSHWIETGTRSFASLADCVAWLRAKLPAPAPAQRAPQSALAEPRIARLPVDQVTELDQVDLDLPPAPTPQDLETILSQQVLGQDSAVRGLAELAAHHVAKPYPRRPASALLIGATGTGKTLAAEQLALHLTSSTGSTWSYERLDLNEFSEKHSAARLFGAPPGYIGYDDGRDLAATLRANPRTVVVLDEIDKAHPQLWRSLMNLMDAGRLSGQAGDIDARQAILLLTSNKDAAAIQPLADAPDDRLRAFLRDHGYPPEIVGRLGRILVFQPLTADITARLIVLTVQRVVESWGFQLQRIAPEAVTALAHRAPLQTGGRDVEHFIERELSPGLASLNGVGSAVSVDESMLITAEVLAESPMDGTDQLNQPDERTAP
jgi:ATP-dependent Clp protease ATP-binding subunit ClpA